ncbi:MAG TPA: DciA family protein [Wenzhouxiangella sp.]
MSDRAEKDLKGLTQAPQNKDPALRRLLALSQSYAVIDAKIQGVLSTRLQGQLQVACVRGETLVVSVRSSAWVARANLEAQELLKAARSAWDGPLTDLKVIVTGTAPS